MGLFGRGSEVDAASANQEFAQLLGPGEQIEHAYKLVRDMFLFTNHRLILVDKQGITGKKVEYQSIPYRNITRFSVETAGSFDLDAELKLWMPGIAQPLQKEFTKSVNIYEVQSLLTQYVCCR